MDPAAVLADLDDDQRHAVTTDSLLVAVIAGAGSGKTRVLTRRVAYRVAAGTADETHTVVLTFTREAAGELRRRLQRLGSGGRCTAGTFHSVALRLLQDRWRDRDERPRTISTDRRRLVETVLSRDLLRGDVDALVTEMNWATARSLTGSAYESAVRKGERAPTTEAARVARALDEFRERKRQRHVIDMDDMVGLAIEAIERDATFADVVRWRYRHVLVDEAQDLSPLQHRFVDALRSGRDDLFLVGDPAQAIYGFNGADPSLLLDVSARFPGIEIVRLPTNHRSTPQIVAMGAHALTTDGQSIGVRSARPDGAATTVVAHDDERAEAAGIAAAINRLDPSLLRNSGVAVLARTNALLEPIVVALGVARVPVRQPVHGAGSKIAAGLRELYRASDPHVLRQWVQDALEDCDPRATDDALPPEQELGRAVLAFLRSYPTGTGSDLRAWVDATNPFGRATDGVEVLTFHGAKGREWNTVFLAGCETSLVPHRTATTAAAKAEEARLLYVASTRATDVLVVNWARRRGGYQRRFTPLFVGFTSSVPEPVPAPDDLVLPARSEREVRLDRLREWRAGAARRGGVLPELLCTDAALAAIADRRPATADELDAVTGLGTLTSLRLFDGVRSALDD